MCDIFRDFFGALTVSKHRSVYSAFKIYDINPKLCIDHYIKRNSSRTSILKVLNIKASRTSILKVLNIKAKLNAKEKISR